MIKVTWITLYSVATFALSLFLSLKLIICAYLMVSTYRFNSHLILQVIMLNFIARVLIAMVVFLPFHQLQLLRNTMGLFQCCLHILLSLLKRFPQKAFFLVIQFSKMLFLFNDDFLHPCTNICPRYHLCFMITMGVCISGNDFMVLTQAGVEIVKISQDLCKKMQLLQLFPYLFCFNPLFFLYILLQCLGCVMQYGKMKIMTQFRNFVHCGIRN